MALILTLTVLIFPIIPWFLYNRRGWKMKADPFWTFLAGLILTIPVENLISGNFYLKFFHNSDVELVMLNHLVFMSVMFYFYFRDKTKNYLKFISQEREIQLRPVLFLICGLLVLGILAWFKIFDSAGGVSKWVSVARGGTNWEVVSGYTQIQSQLLFFGIMIAYSYSRLSINGEKLWVMRIISSILLLLYLFFCIYIGSRSALIGCVVLVVFTHSVRYNKTPNVLFMLFIFLMLVISVRFLELNRMNFYNLSFNLDSAEIVTDVDKLLGLSEESHAAKGLGSELGMNLAVVKYVPEKVSYAYGVEFLQYFTQPIPSSLWEGKRYLRGEAWSEIHIVANTSQNLVTGIKVPYYSGPAPGAVASWYYNLGFLGLIIGAFFTAKLFKLIRNFYLYAKPTYSNRLVYLMCVQIGFSESIGHPLNWLMVTGFLIVLVLIASHFLSKRYRLA